MSAYKTYGERSGQALLLIHPLGADASFWDAPASMLAESHFCVAIEMNAIEKAEPPANAMDGWVVSIDALADHLGLSLMVPVGCAVGTLLAASYAASRPDRTAALVLSNPAAFIGPAAKDMVRERCRLVLERGMGALLPDAVDRAFKDMPHNDRYRNYMAMFAAQKPKDYVAYAESVLDCDTRESLRGLRRPTLLMTSSRDVLLPPALAEDMAGMSPHAELTYLEEGAHFLPYQVPYRFADAVLNFLESAPGMGGYAVRRLGSKGTPR